MPKLNKVRAIALKEKGVVAPLILLMLLAVGIFAGVWLITNGNPLKLFSRATSDKIEWVKSDGDPDNCITDKGTTTCPKVKFRINVPTQVTQ